MFPWKVVVRGVRFGYMGDAVVRELVYRTKAAAELVARKINEEVPADPRNKTVAVVERND